MDIIISRSVIRMFETEDHGRGGHDSQSYGEGVDMHVPSSGATVHTQSQQDRHEDVDVGMLYAAVIDATSCTQTDDLDPIRWTPTGSPEEEIALEMEAVRKMRMAKWVETECLWQSTRGA